MNKLTLSAVVAAVCVSSVSSNVLAQDAPTKDMSKISGLLHDLNQSSQAPLGPVNAASLSQVTPAPIPTFNGMVVIDAIATGDAEDLLAELEAMGMEGGTAFGRVVSGRMPVEQLEYMSSIQGLQFASPSLSTANSGLTTSQGDVSQNSDLVRSTYGIDGTGVMVGTLSDSFDCTGLGGGAAMDVANDDLPAGIVNLSGPGLSCTDEGRAMMQHIHDVAPGTEQAFHTAFNGSADFAQGILDLQNAGADIIVDDVLYLAEPMFQDGIIAQAASTAVNNGSAYFSAAGNNGRNSYEASFVGSGMNGYYGGEMHDFDPGPGVDYHQTFRVGTGTTYIVLQWAEPAASAGGPGSASDLNIILWYGGFPLVAANGFPLGGADANIGGDPVEIIGLGWGGAPFDMSLTIENMAGPDPVLIKYVTFGSDERFGEGAQEYATNSSTSYGHSNAANIASVGAAAYYNTAAFNGACLPACLNGYSSDGGTPILFDAAGNPIVELRDHPNFVGPDGGNTTFFGFDVEPDGFPNFFGTSASAPHAAAVAALLKQTDPSLTPGEIYALMEGTAVDMVDLPNGIGPGFDDSTGHGFIDALRAVELAGSNPDMPEKRFVCHKNKKTISIKEGDSVGDHIAHGDKFGSCD